MDVSKEKGRAPRKGKLSMTQFLEKGVSAGGLSGGDALRLPAPTPPLPWRPEPGPDSDPAPWGPTPPLPASPGWLSRGPARAAWTPVPGGRQCGSVGRQLPHPYSSTANAHLGMRHSSLGLGTALLPSACAVEGTSPGGQGRLGPSLLPLALSSQSRG